MRKVIYGAALMLLGACEEHVQEGRQTTSPPEENRFIKEVFASRLFEPTEIVVLPDDKVLFTQRRGAIKQYDLAREELTGYDSIPVYFENEDGLMGIALDPEFEQNRWVYLYYSPVGEEPVQHLSRFSYTAKGLTNEIVVLKVPVQREECCHTGGSIQFGPDGLLYLSTGDNTNPFASQGYSPSDKRAGREAWDASRSSANTNDLRGKILRIKPEPDGSYSIPKGNLFEDDDPLTRPEIYVMGCRNPYRISVDPVRGWLFWGDVGPDAGEDGEGRGPRGHDEFNVALEPGFFGWPLFVGDNFAYHDYDFATGDSGPGFDPENPVNSSPNNTGLKILPPAKPAKIYYPYARSDIFPQVKNGGRNAMAGPIYYSEMYAGRGKFPAWFDGRVIYYDWMRGIIFFLELDEEGNPTDWYPFMPATEFNNVIDMEFGPDGRLYMIEYGTGWFTQNDNARLSRINYISGNRPPVVDVSVSDSRGAAPLAVTFDASATVDYDGDEVRYRWEVGDQVFTEPVLKYTFDNEGVFYPELAVSDGKGNKVRRQFAVEVGNEPPAVAIAIAGNQSFFWKNREIRYEVSVSDLEDEKSGGIDPSAIAFDITHFQSTDQSEALGHQVAVSGGLELIESLDCKSCHKLEGKSIGPSYLQVADRYRKDPGAVAYLSDKVIKGGGGVWGEQAMAAHPDLDPADARRIAKYILSLGEKSKLPLKGTYITGEGKGRYLFAASYEDQGKPPLRPVETKKEIWMRPANFGAATFDDSNNVRTEDGRLSGLVDGSWVVFQELDLTDMKQIRVHLGRVEDGGRISARLGSPQGEEIGSVTLGQGAPEKEAVIAIREVAGFQDVYFVFTNKEEKMRLFSINSIEFIPKKSITP